MLYKSFLLVAISLILSIASPNAAMFHPFYVSVTEISYSSKSKTFEISCKMFAEDIEDVLRINEKKQVDLSNEKQLAENNRLMNAYMMKHFSINADSKTLPFKFVGFEKDKESIYCYLEVVNVTPATKVAVTNSILHDFKKEQINIIHVIMNGNRKSTKLDYPKNVASFSF